MKLEGEHIFKGSREDVYMMFRDPDVLATCIPGVEKLDKIDDQHFEGAVNLRIGPVSGSFAGKVEVSNEVIPESCTLTAEGKGAPGFAKGVGNVHFKDLGDGTTLMNYEGEMQIGGTLASVGQRMIDSVSKSMIRQGFETLDKALEARLLAKSTGKAVDFVAPSEAEIATGVAKEMGKNIFKIAEVRMFIYVIGMALALLAFAFLLSNLKY
jgi:uncharacterized protein